MVYTCCILNYCWWNYSLWFCTWKHGSGATTAGMFGIPLVLYEMAVAGSRSSYGPWVEGTTRRRTETRTVWFKASWSYGYAYTASIVPYFAWRSNLHQVLATTYLLLTGSTVFSWDLLATWRWICALGLHIAWNSKALVRDWKGFEVLLIAWAIMEMPQIARCSC